MSPKIVAVLMAGFAVTGCMESGDAARVVSLKDIETCVHAVARQTGNLDARTLSTETGRGADKVVVGVGDDMAPWECSVRDGAVQGIMSLTDEGAA